MKERRGRVAKRGLIGAWLFVNLFLSVSVFIPIMALLHPW
jgi:hypothetical protein